MNYPVDIVIPVWNRPVATRTSLACLVEHSPQARIIMVNNVSERETERMLEEFAEALNDRAILVSAERNVGRVAALNKGLELAKAPVAIIVQEGINVTAGWLEPILRIIFECPDAGLVVPISGKVNKRHAKVGSLPEMDHGSFGFMAIRRELYAVIGGFDENMDAGFWSLRDYTRRAEKFGYRTISSESDCVNLVELQEFGSVCRREERTRQSELTYCSRWGVEQKFCVVFSGNETDFQSQAILQLLLTAARQGCQVICIIGNRLHKWLKRNLLIESHQNLHFEGLPVFSARRALLRRVKQIVNMNPEIMLVNSTGSAADDICGNTLDDFNRILEDRHSRYFSART